MFRAPKSRGQAMVEFGLAALGMLMIVLVIIEGAFVLQSYLAIQHAAREGARFAVTYQPPFRHTLEQAEKLKRGENPGEVIKALEHESEDEWEARRVGYIKQRAIAQSAGVTYSDTMTNEVDYLSRLDSTVGLLGVRVGRPVRESDDTRKECGDYADEEGICWDQQGLPDEPVVVRVDFRWRPVDPMLMRVLPNGVPLRGQAEMVNEGTQWSRLAPTRKVPPQPTGYQPTATVGPPPATETPTLTPTPTFIPTNTPTPTPTPTGAYIVLSPIKDAWPEETLPNGVIELHNHLPDGQYKISWTDNCGVKTDLGLVVDSFLGAVAADVPEPAEVGSEFRYLCPPVSGGRSYTGTLSTSLASLDVAVRVPVQPPDLVVPRAVLPASPVASETITVSVQVANVGRGMVSDRFAVDIYVDPEPAPVLKGQAGQGTPGDGSPTQWYAEVITPGTSVILNYVITVPPTGRFSFWAQVDTSDNVEELDEDNNILGPIWVGSPLDELPVSVRREAPSGDVQLDGEAGEVAESPTDARNMVVWPVGERPPPDPAKAYEVTGRAFAVLDGIAAPIAGIDVSAVRLSEGTAAVAEPERHLTFSAGDATYHLYNLSPGQYRVYAEVWVSGRLYSASTTIDVKPGEVWTDVDLYLL